MRVVVVVDGLDSMVRLSDGTVLEGVQGLDMEIKALDSPKLYLTISDFEVEFVRSEPRIYPEREKVADWIAGRVKS